MALLLLTRQEMEIYGIEATRTKYKECTGGIFWRVGYDGKDEGFTEHMCDDLTIFG